LIRDAHVLDCGPLASALKLNERPTSVKGNWIHPTQVLLAGGEHAAHHLS
jgi:hypothetical protein